MRDVTFDIAKGIGILAIVMGHSNISVINREVFNILFSFHIPLFFFLSGIFIRPAEVAKSFITSKANGLLKPYLYTILIFGVWLVGAHHTTLTKYLLGALYATGSSLNVISNFILAPLWFLPHLFLALIFCFFLLKLCRNLITLSAICLLLLILGSASVGNMDWYAPLFSLVLRVVNTLIALDKLPVLIDLPWSIDLIPATSGYILAGALLASKIRHIRFHLALFLFALAAFAGLHYLWNETIDFSARKFGNFYICTAQAFLGIYIVLALSRLLAEKTTVTAKYLAYIGQSSLFILIFHAFFLFICRKLLPPAMNPWIVSAIMVCAGVCGSLIIQESLRLLRPKRI